MTKETGRVALHDMNCGALPCRPVAVSLAAELRLATVREEVLGVHCSTPFSSLTYLSYCSAFDPYDEWYDA